MKIVLIEYQFYAESISSLELYKGLHEKLVQRILVTNHSVSNVCDKTIVLNHNNQGKDIGAKLIAIDYLLATGNNIDLVIFLHDKKSPHSPLGNYWFGELTKIFKPDLFERLLSEMHKSDVGICCSKNYIKNEYNKSDKTFDTPNNDLLIQLIDQYGLHAAYPYSFVAGTIFCSKWLPVKQFFLQYNPLRIKSTLEKGNIQDIGAGTLTHSWERVISWIITSEGYAIKGL